MSRVHTMLATAAVACLLGLSGGAWAQDKPIVDGPALHWKMGAWGKPRAGTAGVEKLKQYVEQRTGGKFKIQIGYESFGSPKELIDLLKVGSLEMTNICTAYHPEKLPAYTILDLPFLPIPNADIAERVHMALHEHPAIKKEFAGWNAMPFLSALLPNSEFMGRGKPPRSVADFKGMRVRAIGGLGDAMRKLGAVPTSVDATEVYTSLERGMVDAAAFPSTYAHQSYRTYEISTWFAENLNLGASGCPMLINIDKWNSLPPQYQALIKEARPVAHAAFKAAYKEADDKNIPLFKKRGITFIRFNQNELQEFRKVAGEPVWEEWVQKREAAGIPGRELLNLILKEAAAARK